MHNQSDAISPFIYFILFKLQFAHLILKVTKITKRDFFSATPLPVVGGALMTAGGGHGPQMPHLSADTGGSEVRVEGDSLGLEGSGSKVRVLTSSLLLPDQAQSCAEENDSSLPRPSSIVSCGHFLQHKRRDQRASFK